MSDVVFGQGRFSWVVCDRVSRTRVDYFADKADAEKERDELNAYKGGQFAFDCVVLPGDAPEVGDYL